MLPFQTLSIARSVSFPSESTSFAPTNTGLIVDRLRVYGCADKSDLIEPSPRLRAGRDAGSFAALQVNKLMEGGLSAREELQMEIPYSPQVVDAFMLRHTGGSILAAERALKDGQFASTWAVDSITPFPITARASA